MYTHIYMQTVGVRYQDLKPTTTGRTKQIIIYKFSYPIYIYIYIYIYTVREIQPRIMVATFNGNPSTTIICYSPINTSDETDLDAIYNELSSLVFSIPKQNVLIIDGNMNSQIGKNINKKLSLHD